MLRGPWATVLLAVAYIFMWRWAFENRNRNEYVAVPRALVPHFAIMALSDGSCCCCCWKWKSAKRRVIFIL
uniref:Putative secreted protein n=1 Tax=Anopheles darlingi TaxID=43151 RepID=A0A2M4D926_ANODA